MKHSWQLSLRAKFMGIFTLLLAATCGTLVAGHLWLFSDVYYQQAENYMQDVTALASKNEALLMDQVDQLSVSVLIDRTVQKSLVEINAFQGSSAYREQVLQLGSDISAAVKASVFSLDSVVSLRVYSLYDDEIFVGTTNVSALDIPLTEEEIYSANGKILWAMPENSNYLCVCRAILSTSNFRPIGYMVIVMYAKDFCQALQTLSHTYTSRVYVLDGSGKIVVASDESALGEQFPYTPAQLRETEVHQMVTPVSQERSDFFVAPEMENGWTMVTLVSVEQFRSNIRNSVTLAVALLLTALTLALVLSLLAINRVIRPAKQLVSCMQRFGQGNLNARVEVETRDEIGAVSHAYNAMADSIQNLMEKVYGLELAQKGAEIEFLKMQINPHFLYNTLDTISWMGILNGNDDISDISVSLAKLLRANIKSDSMITVDAEMSTIREYLQIQHHRFGNKISVRYEIDPDVGRYYMPNFLLQPLVENSILHGLEQQNTDGQLTLSIHKQDTWLRFAVSDTGAGMTQQQLDALWAQCRDMKSRNSIGLKNVYRRLYLLYGEACQFQIESSPSRGTTISFQIPIIETIANEEAQL